MEMGMSDETACKAKHPGLTPGAKEDPRDGPYSKEERDEAADALFNDARWHELTGTDILNLRLQVGRGRTYASICREFGVHDSQLRRWRDRDGDWSEKLPELDRRDLARRVWLCVLAREGLGQAIDKEKARTACEWRLPRKKSTGQGWRPSGVADLTSQSEMDTYDDNAKESALQQQREYARERLDALIARMEREIAGADAGPDASGEAADGEPAEELARH